MALCSTMREADDMAVYHLPHLLRRLESLRIE
jgi:hypothetical protein